MFGRLAFFFLLLCFPAVAKPTTPEAIAKEIIAPLIDPVKVATLKSERAANPRLYKVLYWLETARRAGGDRTRKGFYLRRDCRPWKKHSSHERKNPFTAFRP